MSYRIDDLLYLMERLRDPQHGCPWDLEQNFQSIVPHTLEEAYEVADETYKPSSGDARAWSEPSNEPASEGRLTASARDPNSVGAGSHGNHWGTESRAAATGLAKGAAFAACDGPAAEYHSYGR